MFQIKVVGLSERYDFWQQFLNDVQHLRTFLNLGVIPDLQDVILNTTFTWLKVQIFFL